MDAWPLALMVAGVAAPAALTAWVVVEDHLFASAMHAVHGNPQRALDLERRLARWRGEKSKRLVIRWLATDRLGRAAEAAEAAREVLQCARRIRMDLGTANLLVNTFISAGRYEEALGVRRSAILAEAWTSWAALEPATEALVRINEAEALYNLGRWDEAWAALEDLDPAAAAHPVSRSGLAQQRAWILIHRERAGEALDLLPAAIRAGLPADYHAEYHFTRGLALLHLGRLSEAREELELGAELSIRPSSRRNAAFLLARWSVAAGRADEAFEHFERAASQTGIGQGGDGLLAWGDALDAHGRWDDARRAWELAAHRDPLSESAGTARRRLTFSRPAREPGGR